MLNSSLSTPSQLINGIEFRQPTHWSVPLQVKVIDDYENVTLFAPPPNEECRRLRDMCYLATAYSANLGGTGVITGTGPNLLMKAAMEK